jgi:pimeloyl-ACP methyl ester carboxylesterase
MNLESYSSSMSIKNLQQPLLIVHDEDDTETPVVYSKTLHQMAKNAELMITSGLGHYRILRDHQTVNKIVQFIKNQK